MSLHGHVPRPAGVVRTALAPSEHVRDAAPDDLRHATSAAPITFELVIADLTGPWQTVGRLELEDPLSDQASAALRFDPWNAARSFRPVGPLNHLRATAYRASRRVTTSP